MQVRVSALMAIGAVKEKKRPAPRLIIRQAITKPRAACQQGQTGAEPQSENSDPGTTSHQRPFRPGAPADLVPTFAACSRRAFSRSAAVHSVDQYLATVPSGAIRTMFMVCEI